MNRRNRQPNTPEVAGERHERLVFCARGIDHPNERAARVGQAVDAPLGGVRPQRWTATVYPGPKGNFVFNASTIWWAQAMSSPPGHVLPWSHWSRPHGPDERVQRMTRNLLDRALR